MRYLLLILTVWLATSFAMAQSAPSGTAQTESAATTNQADRITFLMDIGVQYADEREYAEAEQAYLRARQKDPDNPEIRFRLSTLYIQMGRYKEAVGLLEALVAEFPDNPTLRNNLAWVYATGGEMKNGKLALRHAREALLTSPHVPSLWNTLAEAYYVAGQYDKALQASDQALDLLALQNSPEKEQTLFRDQNAKIKRAAESYKMLLKLDPDVRP
jgi:tetratricopeptide (TPR) repeat protein